MPDRDAAIDWIVKHQLSRRNLIPEQLSYYRGLQYEREKVKEKFKGNQHKGESGGGKNYPHQKTASKLAAQHKVGEKTIKNDAQFARAVDTVDKAVGNGARGNLGGNIRGYQHPDQAHAPRGDRSAGEEHRDVSASTTEPASYPYGL